MMATPMWAFKQQSESTGTPKNSAYEQTNQTDTFNQCVGQVNIFDEATGESSSIVGTLVSPNIVLTSSAALQNEKSKKIKRENVSFTLTNSKKQINVTVQKIIISDRKQYKGIALLLLNPEIPMDTYARIIEQDEESDQIDLAIGGIQTKTKGIKTVSETKKFVKLSGSENEVVSSAPIDNVKEGAPLILQDYRKGKIIAICKGNFSKKGPSKVNGILINEEQIKNLLDSMGVNGKFVTQSRSSSILANRLSARSAPGKSFIKSYFEYANESNQFEEEMAQFQLVDLRVRMRRPNIGLIYGSTDNSITIGSGCLISSRIVLTAAHVVLPIVNNLKKSFFYPNIEGCIEKADQRCEIIGYKISKPYLEAKEKDSRQNKVEEDYALLFLKEQVRNNSYMMLGYDLSDEMKAQICGYPADKIVKNRSQQLLFVQNGMSDDIRIKQQKVSYEMTTKEGQSGSPICIWLANIKNFVIGVHSGANKQKRLNEGCLITYEKIKQIKKWINEFDPDQLHTFTAVSLSNIRYTEQNQGSFLNSVTLTREIDEKKEEISRVELENGNENEVLKKKVEIAKIYRAHSQENDSKEYLETILKKQFQSEGSNYREEIIHLYYELGLCNRDSEDLESALHHLFFALKTAEKIYVNPRNKVTACIHNSIGTVYERMGQKERDSEFAQQMNKYAGDHYNKAYEIESGLKSVSEIKLAIYSSNKAGINSLKPNITKDELNSILKDYYLAVKILQSKIGFVPSAKAILVNCYFNSAILFAKWKKYDMWLTNSVAALNLGKEIVNERTKAKFIKRYFLPFLCTLPLYFESKYFKNQNDRSEIEKIVLQITLLINFHGFSDKSVEDEKNNILQIIKSF